MSNKYTRSYRHSRYNSKSHTMNLRHHIVCISCKCSSKAELPKQAISRKSDPRFQRGTHPSVVTHRETAMSATKNMGQRSLLNGASATPITGVRPSVNVYFQAVTLTSSAYSLHTAKKNYFQGGSEQPAVVT